MKTLTRLLTLTIAVAFLSGCMESESTIKVKKDGSGTITLKTVMSAQAAQQLAAMAAMGEEGAGKQDPAKMFTDEEKLKAGAKEMGEGVTFKSVKPIKNDDGSMGSIAVYEFKDITKVKFGKNVNEPGKDDGEGGGQGKKEDVVYTFKFEKGATPKLTVIAKLPPAEEEGEVKEPTPQEMGQMAMMTQMMAGLKISQSVEVDGTITKTNGTHVNKERNTVLLMSMDLDEIAKNQEDLKKMMMMQKDPSNAAKQKINGIKMQDPTKELTIEFK